MQLFSPSLLSALLPLITLSQAVPLAADGNPARELLPRSQFCYGSTTKAGTRFEPRDLGFPSPPPPSPHLTARSPAPARMIFCAPGTSTYVVVDFAYQLPHDSQTLQLLVDAHHDVSGWVSDHGDGVLAAGYVTYEQHGLELHCENANNHQLTWGVLGSAIFALWGYVNWLASTWTVTGAVNFAVYDGAAQVGMGQMKLL